MLTQTERYIFIQRLTQGAPVDTEKARRAVLMRAKEIAGELYRIEGEATPWRVEANRHLAHAIEFGCRDPECSYCQPREGGE